jgi:uncharacterized protein (TIGR03067 family)
MFGRRCSLWGLRDAGRGPYDGTNIMDISLEQEIAKFQGDWKQTGYEKDGVREPIDDEKDWEPRTTIIGTTFVVRIADGSSPIRGTFTLDPTRDPKAIDWTDTHGVDAGKTFPAIYSLEGDELIFCAASEGQTRPTEFKTKLGEVLRIFQREPLFAAGDNLAAL